MPNAFKAIGPDFCSAAGDVYWGAEADCDAVECYVVLSIPLVPLRAVHVFDHKVKLGLASVVTGLFDEEYQYVPIRYRWQLFARALFRRISAPLWILGVLGALFGVLGENVSAAWKLGLGVAGSVLLAGLALCTWSLWRTDRRNKNIRYVLGRHEGGSSDPASWTEELLNTVSGPLELFKTKTYGGAVAGLVDAGKFSQAMWVARLCTALEDRDKGEQLTDDLLDNLKVRAALGQLKSQAGGTSFQLTPAVSVDTLQLWEKLMAGKRSAPADKPRKGRSDSAR